MSAKAVREKRKGVVQISTGAQALDDLLVRTSNTIPTVQVMWLFPPLDESRK